ncbi:transposase [Allobaculum sp. JKK-2023]|uniref:transposase n=1 Tax=Allobaculum sp. JKK-2023 TaxID=3108943 RepID=UPI002B05C4AE|nr:transposase [Allobaculum sp. JKK-2023]
MFMDQACEFVSSNQDDIFLDADSTKADLYGKQEGAARIHHYSQIEYHPFVINEYNSKALVGA